MAKRKQMSFILYNDDCLTRLKQLEENSVDSIVTDPPYGLSFMGKKWDYDVPSEEIWAECLRVLKPGGHLLAFAGTRTQHRMAVRIEDAGFEIRDMIAWVYGSGFPKSLDVSKAIDKTAPRAGMFDAFAKHFSEQLKASGKTQKEVAALFPSKTGGITGCVWNWANGANVPTVEQWGILSPLLGLSEEWTPLIQRIEAEREVIGKDTKARSTSGSSALPTVGGKTVYKTWDITSPATEAARQWQGWGTALKPALEPLTVARKPLIGTVAENVLAHGTGAMNIDATRVGAEQVEAGRAGRGECNSEAFGKKLHDGGAGVSIGRWPANLIHDGNDEVVGLFPADKQGSAARFFYAPKASKRDRDEGLDGFEAKRGTVGNKWTDQDYRRGDEAPSVDRRNHHPTVKPTDLMRYLCRLVTPPNGVVLDPFMGSGSTGKAAMLEGFQFIGIEREAEYVEIAKARIQHALDNQEKSEPDVQLGLDL